MISFPCKCGQIIEVADDRAGLTVQCPHCGLLRDIPTLSDLNHLTTDGTYDIEPATQLAEEHRIEQVRRAFSSERMDDQGDEIDLRPTLSDVKRAGYIEEVENDQAPHVPKYDPDTGELVEPIKVQGEDIHPSQIPTAQRFISYASSQQQSVRHSGLKIFLELFQPVNVVVMFFILLAHGFWEFFSVLPLVYMLFFIPIIGAISLLLMAHYAIVIEEIAIEERDELPRPLRQFEFGPDIFWPCVNVIGALLLAFGPAYFAWIKLDRAPLQMPAVIALVGIGLVFFPSILLTLITSGTIRNIRPDRLVGVILQSGLRYLIAVGLFPMVMIIYGLGILGTRAAIFQLMGVPAPLHWYNNLIIVFPALVIGIYMMHYFSWYLGLIYRDYHEVFPWVLQRHIPTRLLERTRT